MLQTLPLVLFIVMAEVSIGAVSVLVFLDWRNEVKRGFLISYALIYLLMAGLTYLIQQNFSTPELLNTFPQLDKAWTPYQALPLLLFFLLLIPYSLFLLFDKRAGIQDKKKEYTEEDEGSVIVPSEQHGPSVLRVLRLVSGVATVLAGIATLFVLAMIYRPLAATNVGGAFTVIGFFAAAFALGGVMTAMWLGHWYLVTPALTEKPLQFSTTLVLAALLLQVVCAIAAGPTTTYANQPVSTPTTSIPTPTPIVPKDQIKPVDAPTAAPPLSTDAIGWIHILVGFLMPLVLGALSWKLIHDRSFQSATGMLYLVVVCTIAGELMARGLFLVGL